MMPLAAADLTRLETALRVALGPADHGSAPAWGAALCAAAADLVGEEPMGSVLSMGERSVHRVLHTDVPASVDRAYREEFAAHDVVRARMHARRLPVAHELDVCTREESARSAFYNEFSVAMRVPCNYGVTAMAADGLAHRLMLTYGRWPADAVRERAAALLPLLAPAFAAGAPLADRLLDGRSAMARVVDLIAEPTLVCDRRGAPVHRNPACEALLADLRARGGAAAADAACAELRALAAGVGTLLRTPGAVAAGDAPPPAVRAFRAGAESLRARACFTVEGSLAPEALVWVTVERAGQDAAPAVGPAAGDAGAAAGLTRQERAVARLMAERRTDAEIATALGISPHTARTHAERVRRKLGVTRRAAVAEALRVC